MVWKTRQGSVECSLQILRPPAEEQKVRKAAGPHRQVARLPVDFDTQVRGEVVFLRAAGLRQAEPQLDLDREVALLRRPSEHREQHRKASAPSPPEGRRVNMPSPMDSHGAADLLDLLRRQREGETRLLEALAVVGGCRDTRRIQTPSSITMNPVGFIVEGGGGDTNDQIHKSAPPLHRVYEFVFFPLMK